MEDVGLFLLVGRSAEMVYCTARCMFVGKYSIGFGSFME